MDMEIAKHLDEMKEAHRKQVENMLQYEKSDLWKRISKDKVAVDEAVEELMQKLRSRIVSETPEPTQ